MKILLHRFLPILLLPLLLALPVGRCAAQLEKDSSVDIIAPPVADEEYKDEEAEDTGTTVTDIVPYRRSTLPADTIAAYKRNASFAYIAYLDSLLRAEEKARAAQPPEETVTKNPSVWDTGFVKLLCYFVAIGLVGFVVYKLLGQGFFFRNKKTTATLPEIELDEAATESDLEKALRTAIDKKEYRRSVRYLFLMTLQRLGESGALQLSTEKTNYQYATELAGKPFATRFAQLSLQYEYVWFGNFTPNEQQFAGIRQQYQQFLKDV